MDAPGALPDHTDWLQVALEGCPQCGFQPVSPDRVPGRIRETKDAWRDVLNRPDATRRPNPTTWSALEYACHVRDICGAFSDRLDRMLAAPNAVCPEFDEAAAAASGRYWAQVPREVAESYALAAERIAQRFIAIPRTEWNRRGRRSDGPGFSIASLSNHFLHELEHHLVDVGAPPIPR